MPDSLGEQPTSSSPLTGPGTPAPATPTSAEVPRSLGPIRLIRQLGRGGMGVVWLGRHEILARDVAVKFLLGMKAAPGDPALETFFQGARVAAAIRHPGLNEVLHADVSEGVPYLVLAYIDGPNLSVLTSEESPMSAADARPLFAQVCEAVAALHEQDLIHRDIKPSNIMLGPDGRAVLTDFGLASVRPPSSLGGVVEFRVGTPAHMAPEMFDGVVSARTDVYALGMTAYHLLAGRPAFIGTSSEIARQHRESLPDFDLLRKRAVPEAVIEVIERALHKQALYRPKTARYVLEGWEKAFEKGGLVGGTPPRSAAKNAAAAHPASPEQTAPTPEYLSRISALAGTRRDELAVRASAPTVSLPLPAPRIERIDARIRADRRAAWACWLLAIVAGSFSGLALQYACILFIPGARDSLQRAWPLDVAHPPGGDWIVQFLAILIPSALGACISVCVYRRIAPDRKRGLREVICGRCGYLLSGSRGDRCPECAHRPGASIDGSFRSGSFAWCGACYFIGLLFATGVVAELATAQKSPAPPGMFETILFLFLINAIPAVTSLSAYDARRQRSLARCGRSWCPECGAEIRDLSTGACSVCRASFAAPPAVSRSPAHTKPAWRALFGMSSAKSLVFFLVALFQAVLIFLAAVAVVKISLEPGMPWTSFASLEFIIPILCGAAAITALQFLFLLPVREPAARTSAPVSLWLSIAAAGFAGAALLAGLLLAGHSALLLSGLLPVKKSPLGTDLGYAVFIPLLAGCWIVTTPLLFLFMRRGRVESRLAKVASALFLGSIVELAAVIPLDVMIRRRSDCHCAQGTYFALIACLGVGFFAFGPGIFLIILSKHRKRWYSGRCDVCSYDMTGSPHASRCPECGAGWRAPA